MKNQQKKQKNKKKMDHKVLNIFQLKGKVVFVVNK